MKTIYNRFAIILLCAGLVFGTIACKKDYLKPNPLSFYEPGATYTDAASMRAALVACAVNFRIEYYGGNPPILTELLFTDLSVEGTTDKSGPAQNLNLEITPDLVYANNDDRNKIYYYWFEAYRAIKYANTVIGRIDDAKYASPAERNQILGSAYFYRAMRYYRLTNQFGDVPAVMKEATSPKLDYVSTKREVILQKIKLDLDSALLWTTDNVNKGEVSKGAVAHLLIKVNLALGNFDEAIAKANSLINGSVYSLMRSSFGSTAPPVVFNAGSITPVPLPRNIIWDLHRPENKSIGINKEGIYNIIDRFGDGGFGTGMQIMRNATAFWGTNINTPTKGVKGTYDNLASEFIQSNFYGRGIGRSRPSNYFQYELWTDPNDLRHIRGNWVNMEDLLYNDPGLKKDNDPDYLKFVRLRNPSGGLIVTDTIRSYFGWPQYKMYIPDVENSPMTGGHTDWYVFRLADTYLLRAEAYLWKGDAASAAADINQIRTRANCASLTVAQTDMGTLLDERARELYYEEPRKTELTRISYLYAKTGKMADNGKSYKLTNFSDDNYLYDRIIAKNNFYRLGILTNHGDKYTVSPYHTLWPVPTTSINANSYGHINQNKGYSGFETNIPATDKIPENQ
ncbi:MAG: RagB/SusD family nutrient uptake outer membrane protein [Chitinophagaceae bacterium]